MKLPNGGSAVVDIEKLRGYCLSAQHPEGRHKARVFLATLGMSVTDADKLRELLLSAAESNDKVSMTGADEYGSRYTMDAHVVWGSRGAIVRSAWIIKIGEDFPRLVSCYVLRGDA
ncbi:MAG: hypothetical protein HZB47_10110 [Nitrosomonadales bacterium]|nr:hypothetical protein [Nitrosomonadales bacterium]